MEIDTKCVRGQGHDATTGAHSPPIYQTSTFVFKNADHGAKLFRKEEDGYIYSRLGNPTTDLLAQKIAILESAEAGVVLASGSAAVFCSMLGIAKTGDNIISDNVIYGGTYAQFKKIMPKIGISVTYVDTAIPGTIEKAIKKNTKLLFIETPANPTLKIVDIEKCARIAHKHKLLLVVDNTFATPYLQRPIELGADVVLHSTTKYLGGHGDLIGGAIASSKEFIKVLKSHTVNDMGATLSPFVAWLNLRGLKTLAVRMERHCENAMEIATFLEKHPKIEKVYYPGLKSHKGYEIAKRQMSGFGGMIGFDVKGGSPRSGKEAGKKLMNSVKLCILAVSLGDTDTLIEHPASMTHSAYSEKECIKVGINPGFVRLSVGIENAKDLIADLKQALSKI